MHDEAVGIDLYLVSDVSRTQAILNRTKSLQAIEVDQRDGQIQLSLDSSDHLRQQKLAWQADLDV